jgi:hypothetical protein
MHIKAVTRDRIHWRIAPFAPLRTSAALVRFSFVNGSMIFSNPSLVPIHAYTLVQKEEDEPEKLDAELFTDSRWEAVCWTAGIARYKLTFATIEPGTAETARVLGYYCWNLDIMISFG